MSPTYRHAAVGRPDPRRPAGFGPRAALLFCLFVFGASCAEPPIPEGERPLGVVDSPRPGATVKPMPLLVGGWALGPAAVSEVRVYLGGELKAVTRPNVPRPDVSRAHPELAGETDLHGWNVEIEVGPARGNQMLTVRVVDGQRRVADLASVPIHVEPW